MNGAACKDGGIRSGDKILVINGQDVSAIKQDLVAMQLQVLVYIHYHKQMIQGLAGQLLNTPS